VEGLCGFTTGAESGVALELTFTNVGDYQTLFGKAEMYRNYSIKIMLA